MIRSDVVRVFQEADLEKIRPREEDTDRDLGVFTQCLSYTFYDGEQIVAIMGSVEINQQTCEVFAVFDECAERYKRRIFEYARWLLARINDHYARLQAIVRTDWTRGRRFLELLGFVHEGVLQAFGPGGSDYSIYARVK